MRFLMFLGLTLFSASANAEPVSFADTVEGLLPSVVSVSSVKTDGETPDMVKALRGSPFEQFFSEHYRDGGFDSQKSILLGSGFVYDDKGHILTSAHVVEALDGVRVTLNDGSVVSAKVAGRDAKTDIALLKADNPQGLKPVKIGNSDTARIGDAVLAIGNPFGLGNTVTSGIVSARSRDIQVGPYDDFIQTDAAINRGNSGGPLFNVKGELIGVNTAIFSPSGGSVGIAFAAPSNIVKAIADSLIKDGVVRRGRLGLKVQSVSPELAKTLKLPKAYGAYVTEVENPKTTVKKGDVIVSFNGREVPSMRALPKMAAFAPVGSTARLGIVRNGQKLTAPIVLMELKDAPKNVRAAETADSFPIPLLGIAGTELTPEIRQKNGISKAVSGILVTKVASKSDAAQKGIKAGDVIVELDKKPVKSVDAVAQWAAETAEMGLDTAFVLIDRGGERFFAVVKFSVPED
mgnify:FL=1